MKATSRRPTRCSARPGRRSPKLPARRSARMFAAADGCSIPTYAFSCAPWRSALRGWRPERGWRRGAPPPRVASSPPSPPIPKMVAGDGRFDTEVMRLFGPRVFVKTGGGARRSRAALPELGLGLAVKADDGATRAARSDDRGADRAVPAARRGGATGASRLISRRGCATGTAFDCRRPAEGRAARIVACIVRPAAAEAYKPIASPCKATSSPSRSCSG